jgi:hypothetical protein
MNTAISIINSELFWAAVAALAGYAANSVVSRCWLSRLAPSNPWRRAVRLIHGFLNRVDPITVALLVALSGATACAGSFDTARATTPRTVTTTAVDDDQCHAYSERQYWFTASGIVLSSAAAASAGSSLALKSDGADTALKITALTSGALAAGATYLGSQAGTQYVAQCQ